jgi:uncharacterized protein YaiL (DUF2058 family)
MVLQFLLVSTLAVECLFMDIGNSMSDKLYKTIDGKRREMNAEEIAQFEKDRAEQLEREKLFEAETTAKAQAKESAMAKLRKLGLTDDEIAGLIS